VMLVIGIATWEGYYSIFYVLSMMISSVCMSFSSAQNIRKSILVTSTLVLIYDIFVGSIWGVVYESVAIISAIIGIIVYIKKDLGNKDN
ncbi:MAG: YgjV family protein, partial [Clostridia bacterium]|nr:YgjV family protein [Clostridia bacterium]